MPPTLSAPKSFKSVVTEGAKGSLSIALTFDPASVWGKRPRYHVGGTLNGCHIRAIIGPDDKAFTLGPAWRRDNPVEPGDKVSVTLSLEGPQKTDLAEDF